jgi:ectoine hydroxylase-related dioxygenase (phytanoyl-CoA dioxygenase family)
MTTSPDGIVERVEASTERLATAAQRERFERDGYLVIDGVADEEVLDGIVTDLEGLFGQAPHDEGGVRYFRNRIQDAWRISGNVKALALSAPVHALLSGLYDRRPLPFQTLNFLRGSQQAAHSDAIQFNTMPEGFMCGVWVALEDMDMDNGPLVYYPGTHKLPYLRPADIGVEATWENYESYVDHISGLIERDGLEPRYGDIRKGQAIVWAANLVHGGMSRNDPTRTRRSQVTHYFFEGCRYYTPMASEGEDVRWRDPVWVA